MTTAVTRHLPDRLRQNVLGSCQLHGSKPERVTPSGLLSRCLEVGQPLVSGRDGQDPQAARLVSGLIFPTSVVLDVGSDLLHPALVGDGGPVHLQEEVGSLA